MWEREVFDGTLCSGSVMVIFRGFKRYIDLLKTTRKRLRTEKGRVKNSPENNSNTQIYIYIYIYIDAEKKFKGDS
jgi:hypothetical protein